MPYIPNALTDSAPAAAVLGQKLYIAFKGHDSDHIYLASSDNPADSSSWRTVDLYGVRASPRSPKDEPMQIRTSHGPALTATDRHLWLTFKGHNNPVLWQIALREPAPGAVELLRYGRLDHAQTAQGPAAAGPTMDPIAASGQLSRLPTVVYRGNQDDDVWIHTYMPDTDRDLRLAGTRTEFAPAAAYEMSGSQETRYVAYLDSGSQQVMFTRHHRPDQPGLRRGWQQPAPVAYAYSSHGPALAVHDGILFLARKSRSAAEHQIVISSWDDNFWVTHGSMPRGVTTDQAPALVSYRDSLYVVYKAPNSGRVGYAESNASRREVRTTIVVSLSGASASSSGDFHDVVQRCAAAHGYPLTGNNWAKDQGDWVAQTGDAARIRDVINRLASRQGGDKHHLSLLVAGKSAGGVLAWNTFKRHFGSEIDDFHRVSLVLVDPHGSVTYDDRAGPYCDGQDLWWPSNWSDDRNVLRVYNIRQRRDNLTGANFPDKRVYRNILLSGSDIDHYNIIDHARTHGLITEALSFALSGE